MIPKPTVLDQFHLPSSTDYKEPSAIGTVIVHTAQRFVVEGDTIRKKRYSIAIKSDLEQLTKE
jgi:hypothetical protein